MPHIGFFGRAALAGALALSVLGGAAAIDGAQAMPVAAAPALGAGSAVDVQYYRHGYPRRRFGRRAGLYRCGPGALSTHLQRKACGYAGPARQFLYRR